MMSSKRHCRATQLAVPSSETGVKLRRNTPRDRHIGGGRYCRNGGSPMLLALETPMYPPGNVIHVIRSHPKDSRSVWCSIPVYNDKCLCLSNVLICLHTTASLWWMMILSLRVSQWRSSNPHTNTLILAPLTPQDLLGIWLMSFS